MTEYAKLHRLSTEELEQSLKRAVDAELREMTEAYRDRTRRLRSSRREVEAKVAREDVSAYAAGLRRAGGYV